MRSAAPIVLLYLCALFVPRPAASQTDSPLAAASALTPRPIESSQEQRVLPTRHEVGASYSYFHFDGDFDAWHIGSAWFERKNAAAALIARVNIANRFDESAIQFEADAYPLLSRSVYGYLNLGYSPSSSSFPEWRLGGELWVNLPEAWESSAGFRYLVFEANEIPLLTGTIGKYYGNYWTSLRPFIAFDDGEVSWSLALFTRRYFVDADNYLGLIAAYGDGFGPSVIQQELDRLSDFQLQLGGKHPLGTRTHWQWSISYEFEELSFDRSRNRIGFTIALERLL